MRKKVKAWAVIMPEDWAVTEQVDFPPNIDHDKKGVERKYVYYKELFPTRKDAEKRRSWIVEPQGCKLVRVILTYALPKTRGKK